MHTPETSAFHHESPFASRLSSRAAGAALALICFAAFLLRLPLLGQKSLWIDEGVSLELVRLPWQQFGQRLWHWEGNMALYYLLLRGWAVFGNQELWARALSVLVGVLTLPCVYLLGKRLLGREGALIATLLLAVHAYHVRYSQEARGYALVALLVCVASYFFLRAIEKPSKERWALYALVSALALYAHLFAVLVLIAHLASLALLPRERIPWKPMLRAGILYAGMIWPAVWFVYVNRRNGQLSWVPRPGRQVLAEFATLFAGGGIALGLIYVGSCLAALRRPPQSRDEPSSLEWRFRLGMIAAWLVIPILAMIAISWTLKPIFVARYTLISLPALALLAAAGIMSLRRNWSIAAAALVVALSLAGVWNYYGERRQPQEDWRTAVAFLVNRASRGDGVVFNNGIARPVFEYYRSQEEQGSNLKVVFPSHTDEFTCADFDGIPGPGIAIHAARIYQRVWAVDWYFGKGLDSIMSRTYARAEQHQFPGVVVSLYLRKRPEEIPPGALDLVPHRQPARSSLGKPASRAPVPVAANQP